MAEKKKARKWIKDAVEHPGALKRKAAKAGESTKEFASEHAGDSGRTGKEARLAQTLMGMHSGARKRYSAKVVRRDGK